MGLYLKTWQIGHNLGRHTFIQTRIDSNNSWISNIYIHANYGFEGMSGQTDTFSRIDTNIPLSTDKKLIQITVKHLLRLD